MRLTSRTQDLIQGPFGTLARLAREYQGHLPLLDFSQGSPDYPPPPAVIEHVIQAAASPDGARYTPRPGLERLRELMADDLSQAYEAAVGPEQVLITAGGNQAFCVAISALAGPGDEVILAVPFYFNHEMWLRVDGISPVFLPTAPPFIPDAAAAEALISERTRAIVLVTPGNPTGATIPPPVIHEFADLARRRDIMLVLDETYRVFRPDEGPAHRLFARPDWGEAVVSLFSFSKEFAIPGYRLGAAVGHRDLIVEMMKLFECMTICAPRLSQEAAIAALTSAREWRRERALELRQRQTRLERVFADRPGGFELCSAGAFYAWVRHPAAGEATDEVVRRLVLEHGLLVLPGTIFTAADEGYIRFSYGNVSNGDIDELGRRLREFAPASARAAWTSSSAI